MGKLTPSQIRLGGGLVLALLVLGYTINSSQHQAAPPEKHRSKVKLTVAAAEPRAGAQAAEPLRQAAPADADLGRYQALIDRNIFEAPKPPQPKPVKKLPALPTGKPRVGQSIPVHDLDGSLVGSKPVNTGPVTPPAPTLTGWSYVGYLKVDDRSYGIMQSDSSNTVSKAEVGADFQGFRVESVTGKEIVLNYGGARTTLKAPEDFPILPLGKSATGQPGMRGGRGGRGG